MRVYLAILFSLLATVALAGFNDFQFSGLSLTGGGQCKEQVPIMQVRNQDGLEAMAFGNVTTGDTRYGFFTVTNIGKGVLSNISTSKASAPFRIYSGNQCKTATLGPGGYCRFEVSYSPTAAGFKSYSTLISSDQFATPMMRMVSGTGTAPTAGALTVLSYFNANSATSGQPLTRGSGTLIIGAAVSTTTGTVSNAVTSSTGGTTGRITYSTTTGNINQALGTMGFYLKFPSPPSTVSRLITIAGSAPAFWFGYVAGPVYRFAYRTGICDIAMSNFHADGSQFDFVELTWSATGNTIGWRVNNSSWTDCANSTGTTPSGAQMLLFTHDTAGINATILDQVIITNGYKDDIYSVRNSTSF